MGNNKSYNQKKRKNNKFWEKEKKQREIRQTIQDMSNYTFTTANVKARPCLHSITAVLVLLRWKSDEVTKGTVLFGSTSRAKQNRPFCHVSLKYLEVN